MPRVNGDLVALLARLEIPDCRCPLFDADGDPVHCPHAGRAGHALSISEWVELQRAADPDEYADRPDVMVASQAVSREARVLVYQQRLAAGVSLWHEGDRWRHYEDDRVGAQYGRGRNGAPFERGVACG